MIDDVDLDVVHLDVLEVHYFDAAQHTAAVAEIDVAGAAEEDVHNIPVGDMAMFVPRHDHRPDGRGRAIVGESLLLVLVP